MSYPNNIPSNLEFDSKNFYYKQYLEEGFYKHAFVLGSQIYVVVTHTSRYSNEVNTVKQREFDFEDFQLATKLYNRTKTVKDITNEQFFWTDIN